MPLTKEFLDQLSQIYESTAPATRDFIQPYESALSATKVYESIYSDVARKLAAVDLIHKNHLAATTINLSQVFQESLAPVSTIHSQLQDICKSILGTQELLADIARNYQSHALKQAIYFENSPIFSDFLESFRDLSPRTQEAALTLASHGWFMDLGMVPSELWEITDAFSNGNLEKSEKALSEYFESCLDDIERSLTGKYPHRAHILRAAFSAHRREEFELSIPVFLAQTDGICKETTREYFFKKRNKKPCMAFYVEQITEGSYRAALLSPLTEVLPISASEPERRAGSDALNRHTVLHGESLNYGNRVNGLKAVSLINYIGHALTEEPENVLPHTALH